MTEEEHLLARIGELAGRHLRHDHSLADPSLPEKVRSIGAKIKMYLRGPLYVTLPHLLLHTHIVLVILMVSSQLPMVVEQGTYSRTDLSSRTTATSRVRHLWTRQRLEILRSLAVKIRILRLVVSPNMEGVQRHGLVKTRFDRSLKDEVNPSRQSSHPGKSSSHSRSCT